jgi:glycosyltransferase involved in cell wall biosynthesis
MGYIILPATFRNINGESQLQSECRLLVGLSTEHTLKAGRLVPRQIQSMSPTTASFDTRPSVRVPIHGNRHPSVAVLIPCYNEGRTIAEVVRAYKAALPGAAVYVYNNNSIDDTAEQAASAGAVVRTETRQGKGYVVRRMFSDVDADAYVMVDGDDTYDARTAPVMVRLLLEEQLDMVVGRRIDNDTAAYRSGHRLGNVLLTRTVAYLFGDRLYDMLSGYRVFSRRFAKSFPVFTHEFEIETEMTIHALRLNMPFAEVPSRYKSRPEGSVSKLRTYRDGFRILAAILRLVRSERPLLFFSVISALLMTAALVLAYPLFVVFYETGLVPRIPTAILVTGLSVLSCLSLMSGFILDTVTRGRVEQRTLAYLSIPRMEWRQARSGGVRD